MNQEDLIRHYQSLLAEHGEASEALQYADQESHYARFKILRDIADPLGSVLDIGCGLAHLCHFMREKGINSAYHGVDIVPEFVDLANKALVNDPNAKVSLIDAQSPLPQGYDFAMLSGVFNNKMDDNQAFMETTLRQMWAACTKGIAFNAMSSYVDYFDDGLWYVDPADVMKFCKTELGGHVVLRHDYVLRDGGYPFEFAVYVYKDATVAR